MSHLRGDLAGSMVVRARTAPALKPRRPVYKLELLAVNYWGVAYWGWKVWRHGAAGPVCPGGRSETNRRPCHHQRLRPARPGPSRRTGEGFHQRRSVCVPAPGAQQPVQDRRDIDGEDPPTVTARNDDSGYAEISDGQGKSGWSWRHRTRATR
jgi:hypothetical protein